MPELFFHAGRSVPALIMDRGTEYLAARHRAAYIPLPWRSILSVQGRDAVGFLQGMLTQDVAGMSPGEVRRACQLERKGHLIAELWVRRTEEAVLLDVQSDRLEKVVAALEHHVIGEDVRIESLASLNVLLVCGPDAPEILRGTGLAGWPVTDTIGPDFHLSAEEIAPVTALLSEGGAVAIGGETLQRLRIEAGHGWFGADMDEQNFPTEVRLDDAISYSKGCYLGQETIARVHYRGQVKRSLYGVRIERATQPAGSMVSKGDQSLASLSSVADPIADGDGLALVLLRQEHQIEGDRVRVGSAVGTLEALPFREARGG